MSYDDIRPYTDGEIPKAMARIGRMDVTPQIVHFVYPDADVNKQIERLMAVRTVRELQSTFMNDAIKRIISVTTDGLTFSGLGYLRRGGNYVFVSNHRDITLDAFLLQHLLLEQKGDTSYIVFGDNLLAMPAAADLFRCNRLISMHRGGTPRAFYDSLKQLSEYLHHVVETEHHSVWIAQKNGRAKDGIDQTAPAIIKMLALGSDQKPLQALSALHIVPMSISYEWDPCDVMKANELALSSVGKYEKAPGEDLASVVTGIQGKKGKVHLAIGKPLADSELQPLEGEDIFEHVAKVLDRRIQTAYHLMPSNFAACDMLDGGNRYRAHYDTSTVSALYSRMQPLDDEVRRRLLLEMYANPVRMAEKYR